MTTHPASPLDNLHDVIAPSTVPWWPLSPIAFALIVSVIALLTGIIYFIVKRQKYNKAKREAIKASQQLSTINLESIQALHLLLKRLVKHYYSTAAANQVGAKWCEQINATSRVSLSTNELAMLYQQNPTEPLEPLHQKLRDAITRFKTKGALNV